MLGAFATVARQWWAKSQESSISQHLGVEVSDSEILIIYMLGARTEDLRPGDMAEQLGVSRPTLSKSLTRLRMAGLIESTPTADDRRAVYVALTLAGREAYGALVEFGVGLIHSVSDGFTPAELTAIEMFLGRFAERLGPRPPIVFPPIAR